MSTNKLLDKLEVFFDLSAKKQKKKHVCDIFNHLNANLKLPHLKVVEVAQKFKSK